MGGGGASVYYSHSLCLLFFSYTNGCNFAAALNSALDAITNLFSITYKVRVVDFVLDFEGYFSN